MRTADFKPGVFSFLHLGKALRHARLTPVFALEVSETTASQHSYTCRMQEGSTGPVSPPDTHLNQSTTLLSCALFEASCQANKVSYLSKKPSTLLCQLTTNNSSTQQADILSLRIKWLSANMLANSCLQATPQGDTAQHRAVILKPCLCAPDECPVFMLP